MLAEALDVGGDYAFRLRGEAHVWRSETVSALQHAVRGNAQDQYREFARLVNEDEDKHLTIRSLFRIKSAEEDGRQPVPLDEVEPAQGDRQALRHRRHVASARSAARRTRRSPSP